MTLPFAETCSYWNTSSSDVESWLDKTEKLITDFGGQVHTRFVGMSHGKTAIMYGFELDGDQYKIFWPVLPTKKESGKLGAKRQAATMIYHDTKARINRLKIFPPRIVFSDYLVMSNGQTIMESGVDGIPALLLNR